MNEKDFLYYIAEREDTEREAHGDRRDENRIAIPVAAFVGRVVCNGGSIWVACRVGKNQAGRFWAQTISTPVDEDKAGDHGPSIRIKPLERQRGVYPVYAGRTKISTPPDGRREEVRLSVPLYKEAAPSINCWPVDLLRPITLWPENIDCSRPPLPIPSSE